MISIYIIFNYMILLYYMSILYIKLCKYIIIKVLTLL
nr:MAG TPA: hypothetical protein [Caudoviricetes sp.]